MSKHKCSWLYATIKLFYFASDIPGSFGQSDLYSVVINQDGTFGKPENLGAAINTEGRETFQFISSEKAYNPNYNYF